MANTILVLGATGGIGGEVAKAFLRRGWKVRALTRRPEAVAERFGRIPGLCWKAGDAMNAADVLAAAAGAQFIFHGAHPANYAHWDDWGLRMFENSVAAAKASGARLILPGNVYNFGPDAGDFVDERRAAKSADRKRPHPRSGMETMLTDAARDGVRSLVVRANDYIGAAAPSSWFGTAMVKPGKPLRAITYPGKRDVGARLRLSARPRRGGRAPGRDRRPAGAGRDGAFRRPLVRARPRFHRRGRARRRHGRSQDAAVPVAAIWALRPVWGLARGLWEMRYLWREPLRLDNAKLVSLIGPEPHTPIDQALRATLDGLGCLPPDAELARRRQASRQRVASARPRV